MFNRIQKGFWTATIFGCLLNGSLALSQDNSSQTRSNLEMPDNPQPDGNWNWKVKTLGGLQFWSDVRYVGGWRVQRHAQTGHFRLIDPQNVRHAWGNLAHCNQELDEKIAEAIAKPCTGKIVIVLHGLMRTKNSMDPLAEYLRKRGEYYVINVQYASSRETVDVHAVSLRQLIGSLGPGVSEINFVGHSLGNIVVRHYLGDAIRSGVGPDSRIKRMVMLGPPNQGSRMARILKNSFLFKTIAGASGGQLSLGWKYLKPKLATPDFEFGIIAGGQADDEDWSNFMLKGKDDFTVSVQETKLAGAQDFLVAPWLHSTIMKQAEVRAATLQFLQHGYFLSAAQRQPIPRNWQMKSPVQGNSGSSD
jgi:pimeloyl-ACP methyl ester carboxylesterase